MDYSFHQKINLYCGNLINSHFKKTGFYLKIKDDLVQECYLANTDNIDEIKKKVRDFFFDEIRRSQGNNMQISSDYQKKCKDCKKIKHHSEYYKCKNKKQNILYLKPRCIDCTSIYRAKLYASNPKLRESRKQRYLKTKSV